MIAEPMGSEFRFEKRRVAAVVTLVGGESVHGSFFTAAADTRRDGGECIGDLLNADTGFFPFELDAPPAPHAVIFNRAHVITVGLFDDGEARRNAGYAVAKRDMVSILLSNGHRLQGTVRIYQPQGHDRLSDWTRQAEVFRYLETADGTIIINAAHIVAITEAPGP